MKEVNDGHRTFEAEMTISSFVDTVFRPWYVANKRPSTANGYDQIWTGCLKEKLARYAVGSFRTSDGSKVLTEFAKQGLSRNTIYHIPAYMSKMFAIAVSMGVIGTIP
jgi:hypothetical protein